MRKQTKQVSNEWKKSGNNWFYLNSDSEMAVDELIQDDDNTYYVDANGVMVTNQWVFIANEEDDDTYAPENYWYYFQNNEKAYKASGSSLTTSFKVINGKKYGFDENGKRLTANSGKINNPNCQKRGRRTID